MFNLEFFSNDRYIILKLLLENQVSVKEESYTPLSQQEISDLAHFSKLKTNKIINELIDYGYISVYKNKRGKYAITKKGYGVLELMQKQLLKGDNYA